MPEFPLLITMTIGYYFWMVFISLKSFSFGKNESKLIFIKGFAQGTTYQVKYVAEDSIVTQGQIDSIMNSIDLSLSLFRENSLISRFNRSHTDIEMDDHMQKVVEMSLRTFELTRGAFDISVKPLVDLWGFGPAGFSRLPTGSEVQKSLGCIGSNYLQVSGKNLIKKKPCIQIDCNGIAQGYSVDVLAEFVLAQKIKNFLVEIGGEVRVSGFSEKSRNWTIGAERPAGSDEDSFSPFIIRLSEGAVTTSGNYRKAYLKSSKGYHHIINPQTGYPAKNNLVSVSVVAKNAITADAFDNAFMVMGIENSFKFLETRQDLEAYFMYRKNDGKLADTATKGFYAMLENDSAGAQ